MQHGGCKVCGSVKPPGASGGLVGPGSVPALNGCSQLGRAAGGGSPLCPGSGPYAAGRIPHRTCRVQLLRGAADPNQQEETDSEQTEIIQT